MTLIARFYEQESQAQEARQTLLGAGFGRSEITLIEPVPSAPDESGDSRPDSAELTSRAVKAGMLLGEDSGELAANLQRGYTLLAVKAPFGRALQATAVVDSHKPIAAAGPVEEPATPYRFVSQRATPLSDLFRLKVLTARGGSLCDYLGLTTLIGNRSFLTGDLTSKTWSRSSRFGLPLLSSNAAPLSTMTGMPTASRARSGDGWSRSFGFAMLWGHGTPLSSFFGIPLLSDRNHSGDYAPLARRAGIRNSAAPLSSLLGLKILTDGSRGFLSRMLPALTGPDFALFGKPALSDNGAPLSSLAGMPVSSGQSGDAWRSSLGLPLLSSNPAPLSSRLGWPLLSEYRSFYR